MAASRFGFRCHRYPEPVSVSLNYWCGEHINPSAASAPKPAAKAARSKQ